MNYSSWENVSTMNDWLQTANTNSGGTFWAGSLITFVVITFLGFLFMGVEAALMTALFLGILVGIMMLYMGLIGGWVIGMLVGAEIILIIYTVISSYKSNIG